MTSDTNPDLSATLTPSSNATVGGGPQFFGEIAGDMGRVDYQADSEKRMFLLDSTLEGVRDVFGVPIPVFPEARQFIRLPASNDQERGFPISALDPTKPWRSARLYDSGMCSSLAPLDFPGVSLVAQIPEGILQAMIEDEGVRDPQLVGWSVEPVLRMLVDRSNPFDVETGLMRRDADALRVSLRIRASEILRAAGAIDAPCENAQLDIAFTLILRVVHRVAVNNTACHTDDEQSLGSFCPQHNLADLGLPMVFPVDPVGIVVAELDENGELCLDLPLTDEEPCVQCFWLGDDPDIGSVRPLVAGLEVELSQFADGRCGPAARNRGPGIIARKIEERLATTVERQLSEQMLHTSIATGTACEADCDCVQAGSDGRLVPGARWQCNIPPDQDQGTCRVVAEADRVHLRPDPVLEPSIPLSDGTLEIVVAEDQEDVQAWFLPSVAFGPEPELTQSGCEDGRVSWGLGERPEAWDLGWPFTFGELATTTSLDVSSSSPSSVDGEDQDKHNGSGVQRGRGAGIAAPPGKGIDPGSDRGQGRGTGEAPAQGRLTRACESMCACLADAHHVDPGECFRRCLDLSGSMPPAERQAMCEAGFDETRISDSECRSLCDGFFGDPGGRGK